MTFHSKLTSRGLGYVQHIVVDQHGTKVTIERDEESNYRAQVAPEELQRGKVDVA